MCACIYGTESNSPSLSRQIPHLTSKLGLYRERERGGSNYRTKMVLTVFAWPYGGTQVFLCGSFTGWIEHEQMISAEGSSSIFQKIRDLPPGYYQYKFFVDGVWRFDERQACVQDEYGTINNIILVKEPELVSHPLLPKTFQLSNEIEVSRRRLSLHLSFYKTFELIPVSGKIFALDVNVAVDDAFHVMYEQGLSVVPLWDAPSRQISGMLTASDFIFILIELHKNPAVLTNELLEMHTISAWKEGKLLLHPEVVGPAQLVYRRPLIQAGPDESLNDVALRILQNKISTVPVLHLTQDGTCAQLLHIACLAGILRHICRHFRHCLEYLPLVHQPIGSLPLGTWKREVVSASGRLLLTLRGSDLLGSALNLLIEAQVSSIPIVDDDGALIDVFSRSDITALAKGSVYAHIQLNRTTISQVLELVEGTHDRYQSCKRTDSLYSVMELLSDPVVRRVIVTEAGSQQVEGIITLRDVFNFIIPN